MNKPKRLFIHLSVSEYGNADVIGHWHTDPAPKGNGWSTIGYHYIIQNGYPTWASKKNKEYDQDLDGYIENSLDESKNGIHAKGHNTNTLAICLIGGKAKDTRTYFSRNQMDSLIIKCKDIISRYGLSIDDIHGHYEVSTKSCPNFNVDMLKDYLKGLITYNDFHKYFVGTDNEDTETIFI